MTLDEAIKHCEEVTKEQDKLCKRYDDASGYTRSGNEKIRTNEAKKCAVCAEEHRMLAEWLRDYKRLKEQTEITWVAGADGAKVAFWDVPIPKVLKICEILQESKTEKPQPCEDAISKQTVLDTISELNAISFYEAQEDSKECYYAIKQAIKDLSPVKQEPTGHWIEKMDACECPYCHKAWDYYDNDTEDFDYCPKCGKRLVEPQESED